MSRLSNARKAGRVSTISVPGQSRQTSNLVIARRCGFPDHIAFDVRSLQGSITIQ